MSLNRLRLNLSADSSLPFRTPLAQKTREIAGQLEPPRAADGYTFDAPKVVLNPYRIAPLTALVLFRTKGPCRVSYTVMGHRPTANLHFSFDKLHTAHAVPVFGLYPGEENRIEMRIENPDESFRQTREFHIRTEELPLVFSDPKSSPYPVIPDHAGDVRYVLDLPVADNQVLPLANGRILVLDNRVCTPANPAPLPTHLHELDLLGRVFRTCYVGGGVLDILGESAETGNLYLLTNDAAREKTPSGGTGTAVEIERETGAILCSGIDRKSCPEPAQKNGFSFGAAWNDSHTALMERQMASESLTDELDAIPFITTGWLRQPIPFKGASIETSTAVDTAYLRETYGMAFTISGDTLLIETKGNDLEEVVISKSDRIYQLDLTSPLLESPDIHYTLAVPFTEMYSGTYSIVLRFRDGGQEVLADTVTLSRTRTQTPQASVTSYK